ncbi:hypothetical protein NM688_g5045 [Phlebia brevispora]|uniref:Uncharacterized protein n=1 Tax=Phlebia brevispora TaxID=194682 RepID=A0ACC1T1D8_9APHY|nr:hypothetical protein NM688_g5045 [Phlebia brevispora]
MSSDSWPPQLKEWVARCLGQMQDSNREEAQAELRQVIADAFVNKTLWTTDWDAVQLKSLQPRPPPVFNGLKRKLNDSSGGGANKKNKKHSGNKAAAATSLDPNDLEALNRRAQRFQREHQIERQKQFGIHPPSLQDSRSGSSYASRSGTPGMFGDEPEGDPNVPNWDRYTIVGTCQDIFKEYLRLTSEPKPEQVRPYEVLQKTLTELKRRWREKANYNWICSQFKSLRQDLTVQRIKNEFTVTVYEIHARMALEVGDLVEYNQCQAMLKNLYDLGITGKEEEFTAYRILMLIHGRNRSGQLTPKQKSDPAVQHALAVQRALAIGNYHSLFDLYLNAPNMGAYIMDHFINRERVKALLVMTKAYRYLPLPFIQNELAFDTLAQAREFLMEHRAATFQNPNQPDEEKVLDCKPAAAPLAQVFEEKYRKVQIKGAV